MSNPQLNATLRIRSISQESLDAVLDILREESNAIFVETFPTVENPHPAGVVAPIVRPPHPPSARTSTSRSQHPAGRGLGATAGDRARRWVTGT